MRWTERLIGAPLIALAASLIALPVKAEPVELVGKMGFLGEWEIKAAVTPTEQDRARLLAGPMTLRHVGLCSVNGPEEKSGRISVELLGASKIKARLVTDDHDCVFSGVLAEGAQGFMSCKGKSDYPLTLWRKDPD
jgi:hypothetical protein